MGVSFQPREGCWWLMVIMWVHLYGWGTMPGGGGGGGGWALMKGSRAGGAKGGTHSLRMGSS